MVGSQRRSLIIFKILFSHGKKLKLRSIGIIASFTGQMWNYLPASRHCTQIEFSELNWVKVLLWRQRQSRQTSRVGWTFLGTLLFLQVIRNLKSNQVVQFPDWWTVPYSARQVYSSVTCLRFLDDFQLEAQAFRMIKLTWSTYELFHVLNPNSSTLKHLDVRRKISGRAQDICFLDRQRCKNFVWICSAGTFMQPNYLSIPSTYEVDHAGLRPFYWSSLVSRECET